MSAAGRVRGCRYPRGLPGQVPPTSSDMRRATADGGKSTDSEATSSGGRQASFRGTAAASRGCVKQASGAPQRITYPWIRERGRRKPWLPSPLKLRTTDGRGDRDQRERGRPDPRRSGRFCVWTLTRVYAVYPWSFRERIFREIPQIVIAGI